MSCSACITLYQYVTCMSCSACITLYQYITCMSCSACITLYHYVTCMSCSACNTLYQYVTRMSCSACISLYQYVTCTVLFCMYHCVPVRHMHVSMSCSACISLDPGADPGFGIRGAWVEEGSGDRLRSLAGPGQSPSRGGQGENPLPLSSGSLRNYRHLFERQFWTNHTIFIRPKKLYFESKFCRIIVNSMFLSDYKNLK